MLGLFERQDFQPCVSKPEMHPDILPGKTLPLVRCIPLEKRYHCFLNGYKIRCLDFVGDDHLPLYA